MTINNCADFADVSPEDSVCEDMEILIDGSLDYIIEGYVVHE